MCSSDLYPPPRLVVPPDLIKKLLFRNLELHGSFAEAERKLFRFHSTLDSTVATHHLLLKVAPLIAGPTIRL